MKLVRVVAGMVVLNTAVLWSIIGMNVDSISRAMIAWAAINAIVCCVTQMICLLDALDGE